MAMHPWQAMIWEIWSKNRSGILVAFSAVPLSALIFPFLRTDSGLLKSGSWVFYVPMVMAILYLFTILSHTEVRQRYAKKSFPPRFFVLPMTTWQLLWPLLLLGGLAGPLYYIIWHAAVEPRGLIGFQDGWTILGFAAAGVWLQTVNWSVGKSQLMSTLGIVAVWWVIFALVLAGVDSEKDSLKVTAAFGLVLMIALAMLGAWWDVSRQRHGLDKGPVVSRIAKSRERLPSWRPPIKQPFSAPFRAQVWYEWRLFGYLLPASYLGLVIALIIPSIAFDLDNTGVVVLILLSTGAMVYIPGFQGLSAAKSRFRTTDPAMPERIAIVPLDDHQLAGSKLMLMAGILMQTWILWLVSIALLWIMNWQIAADISNDISQRFDKASVFAVLGMAVPSMLLYTWTSSANVLSIGLTGRRWVEQGSIVVSAILTTAALFLFTALLTNSGEQNPLTYLPHFSAAILILSLTLLIWVLFRARLRSQQPAGPIKKFAAGALILWLMFAALSAMLPMNTTMRLSVLALQAALCFAGLAPFYGATLATHFNRHR